MEKNKSLRKDLIDAWERYTNKSHSCDDLALILELIKDDDYYQEFNEVAERKWNKAMNNLPPTPEERKEIYRKEFAQIFAEYEQNRKMQSKSSPSRNNANHFRKIRYAAAVVLFFGLLTPAVYLYMNQKARQAIQYVEEITKRGEIKTVILPDQTEVTLNAESRIKYRTDFTCKERSVVLYGEALFNVTSDPLRPFTVKTENINIKVVGTVFGVKEYADDLTASVSVASGKVEVNFAGGKALLEQNQQLKTKKATGLYEKTIFDADKSLSWKDGVLFFNRTPIREVVNMVNRNFPQVNIELVEDNYPYLISGKHKKNAEIDDILNYIVYTTGLKCKKTGDKYTLYSED